MPPLSETLLRGLNTYDLWRDELEAFEAETGIICHDSTVRCGGGVSRRISVDMPERSPYPNDI